MEIKDELTEDFININKKLVKYNQALKIMSGKDKPPCFQPIIEPDKLQIIVWTMEQLLDNIREALNEED